MIGESSRTSFGMYNAYKGIGNGVNQVPKYGSNPSFYTISLDCSTHNFF